MSDLVERSLEEPDAARTAGGLLRRDPIVAYRDETCRVAAERMAASGIGRLSVLSDEDGRRLVGIVTRSDLLKPRLRRLEDERFLDRRTDVIPSRAGSTPSP